jgi:hypothetical protein
MVAYVFWHSRSESVERSAYERELIGFHVALADHGPDGFVSSQAFHLPGVPWLDGVEGYEDWYLVRDGAALDALDAGSVSGELEEPHHHVARHAERGVAGLYKPLDAAEPPGPATTALWFAKPRGMSYGSMFAKLEQQNPDIRQRLWQRKMTLGPTPEFCLLQSGPDFLPFGWESTMVVRRPVWPRG